MTPPFHHLSTRPIQVGDLTIGGTNPLVVIAGPCVIESEEHCMMIAEHLANLRDELKIPLIFKASYDKANRTSRHSFRGPGIEKGLEILAKARERHGFPLLTDVHTEAEAEQAGPVIDILQIPAFLSRQTDFVQAVGAMGRAVNVKKGQFMAPDDTVNVVKKLEEVGNHNILLTERGVSFGYNTLVSDFRSLAIMAEKTGYPVCFDATHSVQQPGGLGESSGGQREFVPLLARAACAVGINTLFVETHDRPNEAKSDGPNMIPLAELPTVLRRCIAIDSVNRLP